MRLFCGAVARWFDFNKLLSQKYVAHQSRETVSCVCVAQCTVAVCLCVGCAARSLLTIHHLLLPPRHGGDGEIWLALAHCAGVLATIDSACTPLRDEGARLLEARGCEAGTMV